MWQINCTPENIIEYPLHKHNSYEIMCYLEGKGHLRTRNNNYPFTSGTIIIVPPKTEHGSASKSGFKNISVSGDFDNLLHFDDITVIDDNAQSEGAMLATMIYNNRNKSSDYLSKLCSAYVHFILQYVNAASNISTAVNKIASNITNNFCDCNIKLSELLQESAYAEDYIRFQFKNIIGKTPTEFLTNLRIKHAVYLIDIYADILSLQQVSEMCGYTDYVYFSKKFKSVLKISPSEYKKSVSGNKKAEQ